MMTEFVITSLLVQNKEGTSGASFRIMYNQGRGSTKPTVIGFGTFRGVDTSYTCLSINCTKKYNDTEGAVIYVEWIKLGAGEVILSGQNEEDASSTSLTAIITELSK